MSRNERENLRVKKSITDSLFYWLSKKNFSEITVTDIITKANVARASYYRNFSSKEEIIESYMDAAYENLVIEHLKNNDNGLFNYKNMIDGFEQALNFFFLDRSYLLLLYRGGFGSLIQDTFNRYIEDLAGDMSSNSIERFKLYFISGAVFNILIKWLEDGALESPTEIAKLTADCLLFGIPST